MHFNYDHFYFPLPCFANYIISQRNGVLLCLPVDTSSNLIPMVFRLFKITISKRRVSCYCVLVPKAWYQGCQPSKFVQEFEDVFQIPAKLLKVPSNLLKLLWKAFLIFSWNYLTIFRWDKNSLCRQHRLVTSTENISRPEMMVLQWLKLFYPGIDRVFVWNIVKYHYSKDYFCPIKFWNQWRLHVHRCVCLACQ